MNSDNQPSSTWGGGKVTEYPVGKLQELALLNHLSMKKTEFNHIYYTDISSVGVGFADRPKYVDSHSFPSRAKRILRKGDTVISTVRPNRRSFFHFDGSWEPAVASTGFVVVSPKDEIDGDFLYAVLTSLEATTFYESICEGGAYPAFNGGNLNEMLIPIPDTIVRRSLGSIVATIDEKIRLNTEMSKTLEAIAQTIFKSWFIDFDPVHAKMRGEKPEGMDDATAALFPDSFEESELGLIPKGWGVKAAGDLFDIAIGRTPPRKEPQWFCDGDSGVQWVSIRDMGTYGVFSTHTSEGLTSEAVVKHRVPIVPANTVLMSFKLTVGKLCITCCDLVTNEAIAHFKRNASSPSSEYAYLWLGNFEMESLDSTSSIGIATNSGAVRQIPFLVPGDSVIDSFNTFVESIFSQLRLLSLENQTLTDVRDALLPRLISGKLEIPDEMLAS